MYAVLAGVLRLVDEAIVTDTPPQLLHAAHVVFIGSADEPVVLDAHLFPQRPEFARYFVGEFFRTFACGGGGALDLLPVLLGPGKKKRVPAKQAILPCGGVT